MRGKNCARLIDLPVFLCLVIYVTIELSKGATTILSQRDPHVSVARKELMATEKAEAEARHELQEAEDEVPGWMSQLPPSVIDSSVSRLESVVQPVLQTAGSTSHSHSPRGHSEDIHTARTTRNNSPSPSSSLSPAKQNVLHKLEREFNRKVLKDMLSHPTSTTHISTLPTSTTAPHLPPSQAPSKPLSSGGEGKRGGESPPLTATEEAALGALFSLNTVLRPVPPAPGTAAAAPAKPSAAAALASLYGRQLESIWNAERRILRLLAAARAAHEGGVRAGDLQRAASAGAARIQRAVVKLLDGLKDVDGRGGGGGGKGGVGKEERWIKTLLRHIARNAILVKKAGVLTKDMSAAAAPTAAATDADPCLLRLAGHPLCSPSSPSPSAGGGGGGGGGGGEGGNAAGRENEESNRLLDHMLATAAAPAAFTSATVAAAGGGDGGLREKVREGGGSADGGSGGGGGQGAKEHAEAVDGLIMRSAAAAASRSAAATRDAAYRRLAARRKQMAAVRRHISKVVRTAGQLRHSSSVSSAAAAAAAARGPPLSPAAAAAAAGRGRSWTGGELVHDVVKDVAGLL